MGGLVSLDDDRCCENASVDAPFTNGRNTASLSQLGIFTAMDGTVESGTEVFITASLNPLAECSLRKAQHMLFYQARNDEDFLRLDRGDAGPNE
jgi:hypothetical protein